MKGRLVAAGILLGLTVPFVASAAVILEQPDSSETQQINGDVPQFFSGASQRTPSLVSLFTATGTVRKATVKFDMLNWDNRDGIQAYLYECPISPLDTLTQCRRVVAMDAAQGWDGSIIHPTGPLNGEFSFDFTKATSFGFQGPDYEDGIPLIPTRGYRLELVFTPNSYTSKIYGVNKNDGGFYPFFRLEGDVPTSTPATTTPPVCTENCNSNVMFLPGIEGSRLYGAINGEMRLWEGGDDDVVNLAMNPDGSSQRQDIYTGYCRRIQSRPDFRRCIWLTC